MQHLQLKFKITSNQKTNSYNLNKLFSTKFEPLVDASAESDKFPAITLLPNDLRIDEQLVPGIFYFKFICY